MNPKFGTITHDSFNVGIFQVRSQPILLLGNKTKLSPDKLSLGLAELGNYDELCKSKKSYSIRYIKFILIACLGFV